jgi:hypothetical protein
MDVPMTTAKEADRPENEKLLHLVDLPDDVLRLVLKPWHQGVAGTCRRLRVLTLSQIKTRCLTHRSEQLDEGLTSLSALPALSHLSVTGHVDSMRLAVKSCGPLSLLMHLTSFEMAAKQEPIVTVRHQKTSQCAL